MSGMTRSIPNISSSGNIRPQSMTTISSPVLEDVHVLADLAHPAERDDPEWLVVGRWHRCPWLVVRRGSVGGVASSAARDRAWPRRSASAVSSASSSARHGSAGASAGRLGGRRLDGGRGRRRPARPRAPVATGAAASRRRRDASSVVGTRRDVGVALALDRGRPEGGGRVVHREHDRRRRAGRRIDRPDRAVRLRDPGAGHERRHREPAEGDDHGRIEDLQLAAQVRRAGGDLVGLRVAVVRRPALHDVRDEHVLAAPADRRRAA